MCALDTKLIRFQVVCGPEKHLRTSDTRTAITRLRIWRQNSLKGNAMEIINPDRQGLDPENYWMVSRMAIVEEHYFDNEKEAREYAAARPYRGFIVEPPEPLKASNRPGDEQEKECKSRS